MSPKVEFQITQGLEFNDILWHTFHMPSKHILTLQIESNMDLEMKLSDICTRFGSNVNSSPCMKPNNIRISVCDCIHNLKYSIETIIYYIYVYKYVI